MEPTFKLDKWTYNMSPTPQVKMNGPPGSISDDLASNKLSNQLQIIEKNNLRKRQMQGMMQPNVDGRPSSGRKNREESRPLVKDSTPKSTTPTNFAYDGPGAYEPDALNMGPSTTIQVLDVTSSQSKDYNSDTDSEDIATIGIENTKPKKKGKKKRNKKDAGNYSDESD